MNDNDGQNLDHRRARWAVLAAVAALAGARWWIMSSPDHFAWLPAAWLQGEARSLTRAVLNVASCWVVLVMLPWGVLAALGQRGPELLGLQRPRVTSKLWLVAAGLLPFLAGLLGLLAVRYVPALRDAYPVFHTASRSPGGVLLSCGLTASLILATELFYRGVALFSLERGFGAWTVYLLLPIYVLDHLGAPVAEVAGSAAAGLLLGHMALAGRSVWPPFLIHASCALVVDLASMMISH